MISHSELVHFLRHNGYREEQAVREPGDFLVQGDLISCWPTTAAQAYRFHFFGEELEKLEQQVGQAWQSIAELPDLLPNHLETPHGTVHPGEYVVHSVHGIGIFSGIVTEPTVDGEERSFIALEYAGNDRLLVPWDKREGLMPYIGSRHPRLTRLYSQSWQRTKERVQKDLIGVARGLLKIFAARHIMQRPAFPKTEEWLTKLDETAGFALTADQEKSLGEIVRDLTESPHPMDRLLCGDVGFGKTEVALRAAATVMAAGKQVAFIAPTTILVQQHAKLLQERFADLPIKIGVLSRLAGFDHATLGALQEGKLDIVVGTHRVLAARESFANLGLLIIDEEQKFGVHQKELLKKMRPELDVLSLSATPIPRTLSMSLSGLRGLSMLRTAPRGRRPIQTEVEAYSDVRLRDMLLAELERGGQIYVVHNRVRTLPHVEARIRDLLKGTPYAETSMAIAHGQQAKDTLTRDMNAFLEGKVRILVASSIVEHGLDCPNANTLIVLHSERFGLSDLYQLRGRVGRRTEQAFAYFFTGGIEHANYEAGEELPPVPERALLRLQALKDADVLGSGWSIALKDLEIRGGGNILGNEQHGSMEAIGLLLYSQLLQEEIGRQAVGMNIPLFQAAES